MNILMLVRAYPTEGNPVQGIFTQELVRVLEENGNSVYVYILKGFTLFNFIKYKSILKEKEIDIVHAQFGFPAGFWGAFFTRSKPLIVTIHRTEIVDKQNRKYKPLLKFGLRKAQRIIAVSEYIADEIFDLDSEFSKKTIVLHNGIDLTKFVKKDRDLHDNQIVIGTIGNHILRKGIDILIHAYAKIEQINTNVKLLIAGSGPETTNLQLLSKNLKIKNLEFLGRISEEKKNDFFHKLDIFVLSSYSEGHPITLLEAMSSGCCVVTSNLPAIQTTITEDVNGYTFEIGKSDDLFFKLQSIISKPEKLKELGTNAYNKTRESFNLHTRVKKLEEIYKQIIEEYLSNIQ